MNRQFTEKEIKVTFNNKNRFNLTQTKKKGTLKLY